jgi:hypothetical protein
LYDNPEFINLDNPPAKRLTKLYPQYDKRNHGARIASQIGMSDIRAQCPHFDQWLTHIEDHLKDD